MFCLVGVSFDFSRYTVGENSGLLQPVLILSRPLSVDFTVKLLDVISTASSKCQYTYRYLCKILFISHLCSYLCITICICLKHCHKCYM